jgi:hypothetical protein
MSKTVRGPERSRQRLAGLLPWALIAGGVAAMVGILMH